MIDAMRSLPFLSFTHSSFLAISLLVFLRGNAHLLQYLVFPPPINKSETERSPGEAKTSNTRERHTATSSTRHPAKLKALRIRVRAKNE